ncbi:IscA/HesB family protein [Desulfovibrio inopinatus]|uniref:IscA/HesB family protein n=1 Tax=Desulfovibrio inopinatus TaxID=102109 RepID=UPI000418661F|nr:IscA/HesB family protein [Desulfovibrio inopinatus]
MITMTDQAKERIDEYFADKEKMPIRVFVGGGCSGMGLHLRLEEAASPEDTTVEASGYTFIMESELLEQAKPVSIDISPMGFDINSSIEFPKSTGGCGSCTSCG